MSATRSSASSTESVRRPHSRKCSMTSSIGKLFKESIQEYRDACSLQRVHRAGKEGVDEVRLEVDDRLGVDGERAAHPCDTSAVSGEYEDEIVSACHAVALSYGEQDFDGRAVIDDDALRSGASNTKSFPFESAIVRGKTLGVGVGAGVGVYVGGGAGVAAGRGVDVAAGETGAWWSERARKYSWVGAGACRRAA